jgi:mono/diheme cytochrome c family protein
LIVLLGLIAAGITFTTGWRPIIGPRARALTDRKFESTPERMARGRYLVEGVLGCLDCHSERDWDQPGAPIIESRKGAGAPFDGGPGKLFAPNITPDKETGAGDWTDDMLARAIREGISRDGRAIFPIMPYLNYRHLPDEDLASVIVYLRGIPAVRNSVPRSEIDFPVNRLMNSAPEPITAPVPAPDLTDPVKRGEHILTLASCRDCHTPQKQGQPIAELDLAGGFILNTPAGEVAAVNITPDASGISYYDEATFIEAIRKGQVKARKLSSIMPWMVYRNMTDEDIKAMFAYLRAVKPIKHSVDNSETPTACKLCGARHGLGDRN